MSERTVSVIVPTYRRPQQLARCVAALAALDYPRERLEVLVVDDGGEIPLEPVLAPHRAAVTLRLIEQANAGPSTARNRGIVAAEGEVLAFTDDDCTPEPAWLRELVPACRGGSGAGGLTVNGLDGDVAAATAQHVIDYGYAHLNWDVRDARFLTTNNLAVPAATLRELGGFDPRLRTSEDRDLCDRWRLAGHRLAYAPRALVRHFHEGGLREFWRQHVAYAVGARRFHLLHEQRHGHRPRVEPSFYAGLLAEPGNPRVAATATVALWLAASAVGYAREAARGTAWLERPGPGLPARPPVAVAEQLGAR